MSCRSCINRKKNIKKHDHIRVIKVEKDMSRIVVDIWINVLIWVIVSDRFTGVSGKKKVYSHEIISWYLQIKVFWTFLHRPWIIQVDN